MGIPCYGCRYLNKCSWCCINPTLDYMHEIADDMVLRGEY